LISSSKRTHFYENLAVIDKTSKKNLAEIDKTPGKDLVEIDKMDKKNLAVMGMLRIFAKKM
jgi:hypothetical protein